MQATYNALFQGYVKNGKMEEMFEALEAMKQRGITPTNLSLQTIMLGCIEHNRIDVVLAYFPYLKVSIVATTHCFVCRLDYCRPFLP